MKLISQLTDLPVFINEIDFLPICQLASWLMKDIHQLTNLAIKM